MSDLAIVAIPAEDDYVHKVSSEKVPHCTLCRLGDIEGKPVSKIAEFVQHAASIWEQGPFGLDVDHRGTLGPDQADVVFFRKDRNLQRLAQFRGWLLKDTNIRNAYDSIEQYAEWVPHLTLGYPETPAREDTRGYPGIRWVEFDRIALWYGNFEGPEFRLEYDYDLSEVSMSTAAERGEAFLSHYGIKGMRWGQRKTRSVSAESHVDTGLVRRRTKVQVKGGEAHPAHDDAVKAAIQQQKLKKSGTAALSNSELRELATRIQLEEQVKTLTTSKGRKFTRRQLETQGQQQVQKGLNTALTKGAKRAAVAAVV